MLMLTSRRYVIRALTGAFAALAAERPAFSQQLSATLPRPSPLPPDQVRQFVQVAHSDLDATRKMLDSEHRLLRATWDWGGGDFETALGGAAHMGRRDIATLLVDKGAPLDLFAAAMLGEIAIVRAALETRPALARVPGPHGIPLLAHAKAGGPPAMAVLEYVSTVLARVEEKLHK
ncbi:MAG TPA: hypothetical protein VFO58_21215 [Vicinamibacterales bacterium]|nr:hypothetical protein [Vicinamibacterales bacterium]